jgi:spore maturation protein CgeB
VDPEFCYGGLWSGNFYPALRQLGHEIVESKIDLLPASRFIGIANDFSPNQREVRAQITQKIIDEVTTVHHDKPIDLFLSYFYNAHFDPAGFAEIKKLGIPTVNFYCNSIYQFSLVSEIARRADFSWHPERDARSLYLSVNANPVCVQMGADPDIYHPVPGAYRQSRACFVGQRYADRDRWLGTLAQAQVAVDIYGSGWANDEDEIQTNGRNGSVRAGSLKAYVSATRQNLKLNGLLGGSVRTLRQGQHARGTRKLARLLNPYMRGRAKDLSEVFGRYEVVLNFSNVWADGRSGSRLIPHVRLRDFEAPMCRTCYLTGYTDEVAQFYELGKEIDTYQTSEEIVDKTNYYLKHPAEAERLREAGHNRAVRDHTWVRRFEQLFAALKGVHSRN